MSTDDLSALERMPGLARLFRDLSQGRHLNRMADPVLWAELEREEVAYKTLFAALGYELRMDGRGFAWFHNDEASSHVNNQSRQLALLFMGIFDTQADAGRALIRFTDWVVDRALLEAVFEQHQELLLAEGLDVDGLQGLLETAGRLGFAHQVDGRWELLPAVCRYLDHFEAVAQREQAEERDAHAVEPVQ